VIEEFLEEVGKLRGDVVEKNESIEELTGQIE
jgi:hypothetical protein